MAKLMTFSAACARFEQLVVQHLTIEEAIQEAVDRIFEMGRWPGTTEEVELEESDFVLNSSTEEYFVSFDDQKWAGALGFRNSSRGWVVVDKTALYKDEVNSGDREFIDLGSVRVPTGNMLVSGDLTSNGTTPITVPIVMVNAGEVNGKTGYYSDDYVITVGGYSLLWDGRFEFGSPADTGFSWFSDDDDVLTPDLATNWQVFEGSPTGTPIVIPEVVLNRKYRCPLCFAPSAGSYYALLKKEAPVLTADDFVPVEGVGPLKCAIQAVCYEFTGDQDRAEAKWAEMYSFMLTSQRQAEGPKRWSLGFDSSLKRRPKQFQ